MLEIGATGLWSSPLSTQSRKRQARLEFEGPAMNPP
jgi:hypothetical protein